MSITRVTTPEAMWGDADAKARAYTALSQRYAAEGRALPAVHALWAADISTVQAVMWERVMVASPDADEQFFAIATTIARALAVYAHHPQALTSAADAVVAARNGLAGAFDPAALRVLVERFAPVDHLAGLPVPTVEDLHATAAARLQDQDAATVAAQRKQVAVDCMAVARRMAQEGLEDDAMQQAWQADWAAFEGYLLDAAITVADESLVSVQMRWDLACEAIGQIPALPSGFTEAVEVIRERLAQSLGPVEGARLKEAFAPLVA